MAGLSRSGAGCRWAATLEIREAVPGGKEATPQGGDGIGRQLQQTVGSYVTYNVQQASRSWPDSVLAGNLNRIQNNGVPNGGERVCKSFAKAVAKAKKAPML